MRFRHALFKLYLFLWRPPMATLPQDVLDLLSTAEDKLQGALTADGAHAAASDNLTLAQADEADKAGKALAAHQDANASATLALNALKAHFGIS